MLFRIVAVLLLLGMGGARAAVPVVPLGSEVPGWRDAVAGLLEIREKDGRWRPMVAGDPWPSSLRCLKMNNLFCIKTPSMGRKGQGDQWQGTLSLDVNDHALFSTPIQSLRAELRIYRSYWFRYGLRSPLDYARRYAPPNGCNGDLIDVVGGQKVCRFGRNDPCSYADSLATAFGSAATASMELFEAGAPSDAPYRAEAAARFLQAAMAVETGVRGYRLSRAAVEEAARLEAGTVVVGAPRSADQVAGHCEKGRFVCTDRPDRCAIR